MEGERTLAERIVAIEEKVEVLPEMRGDIKILLAHMNQTRGMGMLTVKLLAIAGVAIGLWNAIFK